LNWVLQVIARFRALFGREQFEQDLNEELAAHVAMLTEDNIRAGMDVATARREALLRIGSLDAARELHQDARSVRWIENVFHDTCLALRLARKSPWLTAITVVSLAIGIGVNITAFSLTKLVLWQPLAVTQAERLIAVYDRLHSGVDAFDGFGYPEYEYFRDNNSTLDGLAAYWRIYFFERTAGGNAHRAAGEIVTSNFFSVVQPPLVIGRGFVSGHDRDVDAAPEVVISYALWRREFAGDPGALGRTIRIGYAFTSSATRNEHAFTIVGVAGPSFHGVLLDWVDEPDFWIPINRYLPERLDPSKPQSWMARTLLLVGRLKPDSTVPDASDDLAVLNGRLSLADPRRLPALGGVRVPPIQVQPLQRSRILPAHRDETVSYVSLFAGIVAAVLAIACLNLANLMIARASTRRREIALRLALGAGRARVMGQMLVESLVLSVIGGTGGLFCALGFWRILSAAGSPDGYFGRPFRITVPASLPFDLQIALFAGAISVLAGVLCGMAPAWAASKAEVNDAIREDVGNSRFGAAIRTRSLLVSLQIALSVVLLVGASLFVRTVLNADAVGRLVDRSHIGRVQIALDREHSEAFLDEIRKLPEVQNACLTYGPNFQRMSYASPDKRDATVLALETSAVCGAYFTMRGIPLLAGRTFSVSDTQSAAIVNETLARQLAPQGNIVGRHFILGSAALTTHGRGMPIEVIAVVKDFRRGAETDFREQIQPAVYFQASTFPIQAMTLEFQAKQPHALFPAILQILRRFDPGAPILYERTLQEDVDTRLAREWLTAEAVAVLGWIVFGLTLIGLFGVVSYFVAARTREIGILMAVGVQRRQIVWRILAVPFRMIGLGICLGIAVALLLVRSVANLLYGVWPDDPASFSLAVLSILSLSFAAAAIPAWIAATRDPSDILRHE
jgi:predicted permease